MKLNQTDFFTSMDAIKKFKNEWVAYGEFKIFPKVIVIDEKNEELFTFEKLEVYIFTEDSNYYSIQIMWEDALTSYKDYNLQGKYRTDYKLMEYSEKKLIIYSNNRKIILQP